MDRYIYVDKDHPLPPDAINIFRAANILDVMAPVLSNSLRIGHYPNIDVYKLWKGTKGRRPGTYVSLAQINELIIPPRIRKAIVIDGDLCLNLPACAVYLSFWDTRLRRDIHTNPILNAGIRHLPSSTKKRKFVFLTLKSLNAFMKDNVMAWGYKSLYYHRILNDDHPIYPDDPMYNRGNGDRW